MDIRASLLFTVLLLSLFSSSVFGFHGKIILRKDGSIRTEGLGHANFEKTCKVGDYCQYKLNAPGFPKTDYTKYNSNYTQEINKVNSVEDKFQDDIDQWNTFNNETVERDLTTINNTLKDIQEGINYAKANLTIIEKSLTDIEAQLPLIRSSLDKAPPCYLNKWEQCQVTTTASSATISQYTGTQFTGSTTAGPSTTPFTGSTITKPSTAPFTGSTIEGPTTTPFAESTITGNGGTTSSPDTHSNSSPNGGSSSTAGEAMMTQQTNIDHSSATSITPTSSDNSPNRHEEDYS